MHMYKCKCTQTPLIRHRLRFWQCVINSVFSGLSHSQHPKNSWRTLAICPASLTVNKLSLHSHKHSTLKPTVPQPLTALSPKQQLPYNYKVIINNSNLDCLKYVITHQKLTWLFSVFYKLLTRNNRTYWALVSTGTLSLFPLWCENTRQYEEVISLLFVCIVSCVSLLQVIVSVLFAFYLLWLTIHLYKSPIFLSASLIPV